MREILFRGKRTDNGIWAYGYLFCIWERAYLCWGTTNSVPNMKEVFHETVCQFTGLYDRKGKKIFEGDIIKCKVHEMNGYRVRRGVIEYHGVGFIMNLDPNSWYDQKNISFDCEVIGNIYDNPELLKGGNEND